MKIKKTVFPSGAELYELSKQIENKKEDKLFRRKLNEANKKQS
jgi:hypothetical protein